MAGKPFLRKTGNDSPGIGIPMEKLQPAKIRSGPETGPDTRSQVDKQKFLISPKLVNERRNWKRFTVDGAIVMAQKPSFLPGKKPAYVKLGPVKDIGMKGLAMHHVEKNDKLLEKAKHLSIVFPGEGVIVDRVPFKIVNELKTAELPGGKDVRTICIAFGKLLPMQKLQLEIFIDTYGTEIKKRPA